jgi:hypothetical protein
MSASPKRSAYPSPELGGESRDVFAALAKRRDDHFDHCQTVVQVFPEASCGGLRF